MVRAFQGRYLPDQIDIYFAKQEKGKVMIATKIQFELHEEHEHLPASPTLQVSYSDAQQLMDDLYHAGVRPTEDKRNDGRHEAQGRHLEDMRQIVFASIKVEKPDTQPAAR